MKKSLWLVLVGVLALAAGCDSGSGGGGGGEDDCNTVCAGKDCGTIGECTCGSCGDGEECQANMCVAEGACDEACTGKVCGTFDGCECGTCAEGEICAEDGTACNPEGVDCDEVCGEAQCGTVDECECGTCGEKEECVEGKCEGICEPVCAMDGTPYECGDDGCGDSCGECPAGDQWACEEHVCVCTPDCDGKACGNDSCGGTCGECTGETPNCTPDGLCVEKCVHDDKVWDQPIAKINYLMIDGDGLDGHGLDVDQDPGTCAPAGNCENGIDNALGGILGQVEQYVDVGEELAKVLDEGDVVLLAEMDGFATDGTEFTMNMYIGEITGDKATCDYQTVKCNYLVDPMSYDLKTCLPVIMFDNATVNDNALVAGGPGYLFSVAVPIQEGLVLTVTAVMARIEGMLTVADGAITAVDGGLVGGAVPKALIMEAVDNLPPDLELPVSPALIKGMLDMFIVPDIDAGDEFGVGEPDGELESASVGIQFTAIEGAVSGFKAEE